MLYDRFDHWWLWERLLHNFYEVWQALIMLIVVFLDGIRPIVFSEEFHVRISDVLDVVKWRLLAVVVLRVCRLELLYPCEARIFTLPIRFSVCRAKQKVVGLYQLRRVLRLARQFGVINTFKGW